MTRGGEIVAVLEQFIRSVIVDQLSDDVESYIWMDEQRERLVNLLNAQFDGAVGGAR